jgi:5-methylcytosine-specific restriction endonuclease McrA
VRRERWRLIRLLGSRCVRCERDDIPLHFDHIHGVTYQLRALSQHMRIVRLRREVAAGEIQLLCEICNKRKGKPMKRTAAQRLQRIREIIELVDHRALATDGPVPSTMQCMTQKEMDEIYRLAGGVPGR